MATVQMPDGALVDLPDNPDDDLKEKIRQKVESLRQAQPQGGSPTPTPSSDEPIYQPAASPEAPRGGYFLAKAGVQPEQAHPPPGPDLEVERGLGDILRGLVPTDVKSAGEFASPVVSGVEDIFKAGKAIGETIQGEPMAQAGRQEFPEAYRYEGFGGKPLREQVATVGGDVANALMAIPIAGGLRPSLRTAFDPMFRKHEPISETPLSDAATKEVENASQIQSTTTPDGGVRTRSEVGQLPEGNVPPTDARLRSDQIEQTAGAPEAQAAPDIVAEPKQVEHPLSGNTYFRGTHPEQRGGDTFYTADRSTAEEYSAHGKTPEAGAVTEVKGESLPTNLYDATTKEQLAEDLGIKGDTRGLEFDSKVKSKLQSQGYEGVRYSEGTSLGDEIQTPQEEIHVFGKAPPAAAPAAAAPKLLPGETQGDLLSSTQTEPLKLVGETAVDHEARALEAQARAEEKATAEKGQMSFEDLSDKMQAQEEARLKREYEQGLLEEVQQHEARGGDELVDVLKAHGLPLIPEAKNYVGELKNIRENFASIGSKTGKTGYGNIVTGTGEKLGYQDIFRKGGGSLDSLLNTLRSKGFDVESIRDLEDLIGERFRTGKKVFGSEARAEAPDWTGATAPLAPFRPQTEGGFLGSTSGTFKSIAIKKRTPLDAATGLRSERLQKSFADAQRAQKEIGKVAPTDARQNAISVWMEAGGDRATIDQWASAAKGKMFKRAAEAAKTLKPEEVAIAQKVRNAFDVLGNRGKTYGILNAFRDNYVPHIWDVTKKFTGIGSSKLQDRFKFAKARTFENFFEGDQAGFVPKTMAIGKVLPSYLHEMNKVIADRQFVQDVSSMTASDKRPLVVPRGNAKTVDTTDYVVRDESGNPLPKFQKAVYDTEAEAQAALKPGQTVEKRPSSAAMVNPRGFAKAEDAQGNPIEQGDYKVLDQPALTNWRWVTTNPEGGTTILKSDLAVHPELAKRLNAMTGQSAIRQWYNEPSTGLSVIPKAIAKGIDTAQAVAKREMFGLLAPFHQVQEGTHAVGHTVNPLSSIPNMDRLTPAQADAVQHGLMLLPEKTSAQSYLEGLGGKGTFISQLSRWAGGKVGDNFAGKAITKVADVIDGYQDFLFHKYIPGLKFKTYEHIVTRNMDRYAAELKRGEVTPSDVKMLSAQQTDAAYGHLNYAQLDRNPTIQHLLQLTLLAPDFLEARARFAGQSLKVLAGEKAGAEQFRAVAVLAVTQAATMYTLSKVLGGDWDAKHPFEMVVKGRRYMLRSVPEDLHRLFFQGPDVRREFVSARINPTAQKIDQLRTGLNYRGEKTGALDTIEELLANYIPITARSIPGVKSLTETSRNNPVSPLEQLAGSMGLKISRYSPITKTHQLASEWMDKKGLPRDKGSYPVSKYIQLRYALEDGDLARAKTEWSKLSKGQDVSKLAKGFRQSINSPFTGSNKSDTEFAASLKNADRMIYDHAKQVRQGILYKFDSIAGGGGSIKVVP